MEKKYLKTSEILAFSSSAFGRSMIYTLMSTFLLIFYTDAMQLTPSHAGLIILAARIFDAANDPVMGIIADKTKTKFGKLRPYLLFSPFLIMITTAALFYVPNFGYNGRLAYAAVTYILWGICFTIQDVPFWGLSAVVSPLENERNRFISTARIFSTIGGIVPTLLVPVLRNGIGNTKGYFVSGLIFAVLGSMISLLAFFGTKERVEQQKEKVSVGEIVSAYVKNKPLLLLIVSSVLGSAMLMAQTSGSYLATYLIKDSGVIPKGTVQTVMTVAIGAGMMIAMVLMPVLRKKMSLKAIYISAAIFGAVIHGIMYLVGYSNFYVFLAVLAVAGLPLGIFNVITYAMVGDSVDYLEWKTGERGEGICFAMQTLINKIGMAVGAFIGVISFAAAGINSETGFISAEGANTLWNMLVLSGVISMFACAIPMFFYTITEKKQAEMVAEIEARKAEKITQ